MRTIVFSKDRAAQLDLLLRSIKRVEKSLLHDIHVIWTGSNDEFSAGYHLIFDQHPEVDFQLEYAGGFANMVFELIVGDQFVMFLCDDDVFFRGFGDPHPETILEWKPNVLSVSLRLGTNTTECYSLRTTQGGPWFTKNHRDARFWNWRGQKGDWGYPGSLDGNVWRKRDLLVLLAGLSPENPNELEDKLNMACQKTLLPELACYEASRMVGNAVNMVNTTHTTNRYAERMHQTAESLNRVYLEGARLSLSSIKPMLVNAAHGEQQLVWEAKGA